MYKDIEDKVQEARIQDMNILLLGDFNCKVGKVIQDNHEEVSKGGRLMLKMIEEAKMELINASGKCCGKWTREEGGKNRLLIMF